MFKFMLTYSIWLGLPALVTLGTVFGYDMALNFAVFVSWILCVVCFVVFMLVMVTPRALRELAGDRNVRQGSGSRWLASLSLCASAGLFVAYGHIFTAVPIILSLVFIWFLRQLVIQVRKEMERKVDV